MSERKNTWRRFIKTSMPSTPNRAHSAGSTDTELSTLDINTHELWLPESRYVIRNIVLCHQVGEMRDDAES